MSSPTRPSKILPVVAMNHAVNDGSVYLLSSLFPIILSIFGMSVFQVGILVGVGYLVSVVSQLIVGHWSEREDPGRLLALGIGVISISVLSFIIATGFYTLLASYVLLRVGGSFFHPVGVSAISRSYSGSRVDRSMGIMSALGNLGIFLVFISSAPIYLTLGLKGTFLLFALIGAVDVVITLLVFKKNDSGEPSSVVLDSHKTHGGELIVVPFFFLLSAFVAGASFAVVLNYANILLVQATHTHVLFANLAVSGWIGAAFLGAISTGKWPHFVKRIRLLTICFFLSSASTIIFALTISNLGLAVTMLLLNGFTLSAVYPLTYSELSGWLERRPEVKGRAFGALFSAQTIGSSVFGLVSGYLSELYGLPSAFLAIALTMLLGALAALGWGARTSRSNS